MKSIHENLRSSIDFFYQWEKETPNNTFLRQPYGNTWKEWTYSEVGQEARRIANGLKGMGLGEGSHIALLSKNCAHWIIADVAIMMIGAVSVPLYASLDAEQLNEVLVKSDSEAIIIGKLDEWDKKQKGLPDGIKQVKFPQYPDQAVVKSGHAWEDLLKDNAPLESNFIPDIDSLWTILFTSGTTGTPKGVMHSHKNSALIANNEMINKHFGYGDHAIPRYFSFLPLNHIAERAAVEAGAFMSGASISFAESLDTFAKNLQETKPTFFFAVPRIWTKFQMGVLSKMPQKKMDRLFSIPFVGNMVKKKIRAGLGLDQCTTFLTGASITPESLKQWYRKLGINLREVYGMTENGGGFCTMPKDQHKPDTVGKPMSNAEGRIDPDTGEILMKMPWLMTGYYKDPDLTAENIVDGWLHTGDKGKMDADGFISVIGRVKDAFKTEKGEFIVPTIIEDKFSGNDDIEQICVAGMVCPQPVALICLSEIGNSKPKETINSSLEQELNRINKELHGHEKISTIIVTKEPWSDQNKLLTPTLKIRRGAINDKYGSKMREWHEKDEKIVWE